MFSTLITLTLRSFALIPKVDSPEFLKDFRPISLCNVSYKIITKMISNRLRPVMGKLVGQHQCSFIAGRQSSDNIIIAQEVIHSMRIKKGQTGWLAVKVDLEKAYDRLDWSFIKDTLSLVGISGRLLQLIMACISSSRLSVLWNGTPTDSFTPSRGIRQGDPLSPYIFTLCMERLHHIISEQMDEGEWSPIRLNAHGPPISHLFFADDLILFGEASTSQVDTMLKCLNLFCSTSGQKVSNTKTKVYFSKNVHISRALALSARLGVSLTGDLGKYLGIPLLHKRATCVTFAPLLERTSSRLSGWKKGCLTLAGRTVLVKAVLAALPTYYMQTILLPKRLLNDLEKQSRGFLWGETDGSKKLHLLSWEQVVQEKRFGGLGIKDIRKQNKAFIMKLCWGLTTRREALWVQILRGKYKCGDLEMPSISEQRVASLTWRGICEVWKDFQKGVGRKVGNGRSTSFWMDNWSEVGLPLINFIPGRESLINCQDRVHTWLTQDGEWDCRKMLGWLPNHVINGIISAPPPCEAKGADKFFWKPASNGCFSVSSAYSFLSAGPRRDEDTIWKLLWRWPAPEKIKMFMWLAVHGRVHTGSLRKARGIEQTASCPLGCGFEEDILHLLRDCPFAKHYWKAILLPDKWDLFFSLPRVDWIRWNLTHDAGMPSTRRLAWPILFGYLCWDLWVYRCNRLFGSPSSHVPLRANHTFYRACSDHDLCMTGRLVFQQGSTVGPPPSLPSMATTVVVDGSVLADGRSGCGGYIHDRDGGWLGGFSCKLISVPVVCAELIGIIHGLNWCWNKQYRDIDLLSDSIEAVNYIIRGCDPDHPFQDIIEEARKCYFRDWTIRIHHVHREHTHIADRLAKYSHSLAEPFCMFPQPPSFLETGDVDGTS